jgi:sugar transferase (PEP-CTERM system associated)
MVRLLNVYHPRRTILLIGCEALLIALSFVAAIMLLQGPKSHAVLTGTGGILQLVVTTAAYLLCLYYLDSYDVRMTTNRIELLWRLFCVLGTAGLILSGVEYLYPNLIVVGDIYILAILISLALLLPGRMAFSKILERPVERMIFVGLSDFGCALAQQIQQRPDLGIDLLGYVDDGTPPTTLNPPVARLGSTSELLEIVAKTRASTLVVASRDRRGRLPVNELVSLRLGGTKIYEAGTICEQVAGKLPVEDVRQSWLIFSEGFRIRRKLMAVQRIYSVILGALGMLITLPVMVLVALAIKLDSAGPVFYSQERVGLKGRTFKVYKFRSMSKDAERHSGPAWAVDKDPRVTRVGAFLRLSHLDELPQLWNVLRGDMNLVGPRPERPGFVKVLEGASPYYRYRHLVRPGVTGWQQVNQGYCSTVKEQLDRLRYDLFYIKNIALSLDFYILFKTGKIIVWGRGAK